MSDPFHSLLNQLGVSDMTEEEEAPRETKPYRQDGLPISHADLYLQHLKNRSPGGHVSQNEIDHDPMLQCFGQMEHHGDVATTSDGARTVHWDGDVWHHEIVCAVCGWTTTVDTEFKREEVARRERLKRNKGKSTSFDDADDHAH